VETLDFQAMASITENIVGHQKALRLAPLPLKGCF
jgi:hypothetical protein